MVPSSLELLGDAELLQQQRLGLLVSLRCPGAIVLEAFDAVRSFPPGGWPVIGGFHSPMEKQCLESLLLRSVPAIVVLPRTLTRLRIPPEWRAPLDGGRLLILTPFPDEPRRFSRDRATRRNIVVAAMADALFVPFAAEGGSVEACVGMACEWGMPVLTVGGNSQPLLNGRSAKIEEWIAGRPARKVEEGFILT